jgi:hypothetical protein
MCGSFLVLRQFITISFANVHDFPFVKVGMKSLNIETLLTGKAAQEICFNVQNFSLPTQGTTYVPSSNRQRICDLSIFSSFISHCVSCRVTEDSAVFCVE